MYQPLELLQEGLSKLKHPHHRMTCCSHVISGSRVHLTTWAEATEISGRRSKALQPEHHANSRLLTLLSGQKPSCRCEVPVRPSSCRLWLLYRRTLIGELALPELDERSSSSSPDD